MCFERRDGRNVQRVCGQCGAAMLLPDRGISDVIAVDWADIASRVRAREKVATRRLQTAVEVVCCDR